jgi:hypothetical protein
MGAAFFEPVREKLAHKLLESPSFSLYSALSIYGIGLILLLACYRLHGRRYYELKLHCQQAEVDKAIIQRYVNDYWHRAFPEEVSPEIVISGKNRFEIIAQRPQIDDEEPESFFKRLENEIGVLLAHHLGYEEDFYLTLLEKK